MKESLVLNHCYPDKATLQGGKDKLYTNDKALFTMKFIVEKIP